MKQVRVYDHTSDRYIMMDESITMPCGSVAFIDPDACYPAYRCGACNAIEGSVGMPSSCKALEKLYSIAKNG